ncbi:zinc finger protein 2-like isoform X3 [Myzus persicae]|uniref:zinc finger protein 2-like isoform X3 n=1 Tax=Myzus persicae TaxID=13164 RepID=UPI000B935AA1|nr:zinc finger protein 2-like isoform X3 [Myzus persicae]XP_022169113.1 zinc finger protein 2-like isoform X3 [Myzus persicae]XP_022169115.1 zinc finger protein 2-like isoform X3 [Myzus persicae]
MTIFNYCRPAFLQLMKFIFIFRPENDGTVSSKTSPTRKQQIKACKNKTNPIKINMDLQKSTSFYFHNTLHFPLSTDFKISQNTLPIQKMITGSSSSARPIQPKVSNTSNIVPVTQTQSNALLIPSQINFLKTKLQNITSENTLVKPTLPLIPQLKPFIKPIKSIKNKIVYDYKNNTCTIELATNLCQRLLSGENMFMCKKCDKVYTEHRDLLDHYMIHGKCETNPIVQEKDKRENIPITNVKKENRNVSKTIINSDKNVAKQTIPVIKSTLNSKKNKVVFQGECIMCHSVFPDLGEHIRTVHQNDLAKNKVNTFCCTTCGIEFDIKQQLRAHELSAHKSANVYTCEHCLKLFSCKEDLDTHIETHYSDIMKYLCPYCDAGFPNSNGLRTHLINHIGYDSPEYSTSETPVYQIEYSPTRPPEKLDQLISELDNVPEDIDDVYIEQVDDDNYQVSFRKGDEDNASSQINLLIDDKHEVDTELNNSTSEDNKKIIINEHQTSLLNKKRISYTVCRICMIIVSYSRIGRHMKKKHNNAAPYQCEICHAEFNRKHIMDDHRRKHTNNKPHKCTECSKCFTYKHHLNRHMMIVHNSGTLEKLFKCSVCDKAFSFKEYLTLHVNSRHKGKHYMCQVCGKSFSTNAALNKHQLCHTDERPFMCEHCGRTFKCKTHCDTHKKNMHPGDPQLTAPPEKFECELCKKLFSTKVYRDMHLKRHNGQGHQCDICYKLFVSKAHMQRHIKIMHRNTL